MKKYLSSKYIPPVAIAAGILAFLLRMWLLTAGVDAKGLLPSHHPGNYLSLILVFGGAAVIALLATGKVSRRHFSLPAWAAAAGSLVAALGILVFDFPSLENLNPLTIFSAIGNVVTAGCLFFAGWCYFTKKPLSGFIHGIVSIYFMLHLVLQYRSWSSEPQTAVFLFSMLASVLLMLSTYHRALRDVDSPKPRLFLFFRYSALLFCCAAIAGPNGFFYLTMTLWLLTDPGLPRTIRNPKAMVLPEPVKTCLNALKEKGYDAYVVGGCVRDALLGLTPQDYDLCTNATPEQIAEVFSQYELVRSGEKHGTIGVVLEKQVYEITTFRTEGGYSDSRHPDWVNFVSSVEEDLSRRDFTVNAMAYSPDRGYIDPWGGQKDLQSGILRTVGDPKKRFTEDALRILRGVRFAVRYHLAPDPDTEQAMNALAPTMDKLARERVFTELCKLLPLVTAQDLIRYKTVITQVIPQLQPAVDFDQRTPHHRYDIYTHTAYAVEAVPPTLPLRFAALLHDIGKPSTFSVDENGTGHFYSHAAVSAEMANEILQQLRAPNQLRQQVVTLIEQHMNPLTPDEKLLRRRLSRYGEETVQQLLQLQKADRFATGKGEDSETEDAIKLLNKLLREEAPVTVRNLAINGNDLAQLGFAPGPEMGKVLNALLEMVLDKKLPNEKEALLTAAKNMK